MPRVNLVPPDQRRRELKSQAYLFPLGTVVLVAGVLGGSYLYYSSQINDTQEQLDDYRRRNADQVREVQELNEYEELKNQKQTRLNNVTSIYNTRFRWSRLLDDLSFVVPEDLSLTHVTGRVPGVQTAQADSSAARGERDLEFEGFTRSMPDVAIFMVRLALIPSISDVTLNLAEVEEVGDQRPIHFIINASIRTTGETQRPAAAPNTGEDGPSRVTPTATAPTIGTSTTPATTPADPEQEEDL